MRIVRKSQRAHMPIFHRSGAKGLQRLICFKYFIVLKWESRCTLGVDAAEITDYIKKLLRTKFYTKKLADADIYLLQDWSWRPPKITEKKSGTKIDIEMTTKYCLFGHRRFSFLSDVQTYKINPSVV